MLNAFCHISEYGEPAYRRLRALVAVSEKLNLWAPSSVWLGVSGISDRDFVALVEAGFVRVLGRQEWLTDRSWRDSKARGNASVPGWEPAAWTERVDGALRALLRDGSPNVVVAPPERGRDRARQLADEDPASAKAIYEAYVSDDADFDVPIGVRQSVDRAGSTPEAVVTGVLRDIINHADAFRFSGARRPMLMTTNPHSQFARRVVEILDEAQPHAEEGSPAPADRRATVNDPDEEFLAVQLLNFVSALDDAAMKPDLLRFMKHGGRQTLVAWYDQLLADIQEDGCTNLDGIVARHLERDLTRHQPGGPKTALSIRLLKGSSEIAGLSTALASFCLDPTGALSVAGLGTAAIDSGLTQLERVGWIKPGYEGTQWPFIYMFGSRATKLRHKRVLEIVRTLR